MDGDIKHKDTDATKWQDLHTQHMIPLRHQKDPTVRMQTLDQEGANTPSSDQQT